MLGLIFGLALAAVMFWEAIRGPKTEREMRRPAVVECVSNHGMCEAGR